MKRAGRVLQIAAGVKMIVMGFRLLGDPTSPHCQQIRSTWTPSASSSPRGRQHGPWRADKAVIPNVAIHELG